jgi:hypothetical protein
MCGIFLLSTPLPQHILATPFPLFVEHRHIWPVARVIFIVVVGVARIVLLRTIIIPQ